MQKSAIARSCGSCSACCKTHPVDAEPEEPTFQKPAGTWCVRWHKKCGCTMYEQRPSRCRSFRCEWLKGMGSDAHRPDRTRVVIDFVIFEGGPLHGICQLWEVAPGALATPFAKSITLQCLTAGIWTSHLSISGGCRLFIPPGELNDEIRGLAQRQGFTIAGVHEFS